MSKTKLKPVLAVDLGGTKIDAGLVLPSGEVMTKSSLLTLADRGPDAVIGRLVAVVRKVMDLAGVRVSEVAGLFVAAAGVVDVKRGLVTASPNLPGWKDVPLLYILAEKMKTKVFLSNDVKAATIGEHHLGAGRGANNLVCLTVGTGIGGGIIVDGQLYLGTGGAGEIGHMTVDVNGEKCSCGNTGCLEMLASGKAITRDAVRRIKGGGKSLLLDMVGDRLEKITARTVATAARRGDGLALSVIEAAACYFGVGLVNVVNIFSPELIIVGGGVARIGSLYLDPAREKMKERAFGLPAFRVRVVPAELESPVLNGAAIMAYWEIQGEGK